MIAKLFGGPMDGAGYAIVTDQKAPDGLWFNGKDEHGRKIIKSKVIVICLFLQSFNDT